VFLLWHRFEEWKKENLCSVFEELKKFLNMGTRVKTVKKDDIFSNIIPIYYLSKFTGLSPLSLAYTDDQQKSDTVTMKTPIFGVLCNVFMLMWVTGDQFYMFLTNHKSSGREKTNYVTEPESVTDIICAVSSLIMSLIRIRKEMYKNLYNIFAVNNLLDTKCDILTRNEKYLGTELVSLTLIVVIIYAADILVIHSDFSLGTLCGLSIYGCFFTETRYNYAVRESCPFTETEIENTENPTHHRTDNNLWETLLQRPGFRNEDNWKDDALKIGALYQALNRRNYSKSILQDSTSISTQNSWLHKEKLRCRALRIIWDVLCDISSSVNSMYGLQILLCIVSALVEITTNLSYCIVFQNANIWANSKFYRDVLLPVIWAILEFLQLVWITASYNAACGDVNCPVTLLQNLLLLLELNPATAADNSIVLASRDRPKTEFHCMGLFHHKLKPLGLNYRSYR